MYFYDFTCTILDFCEKLYVQVKVQAQVSAYMCCCVVASSANQRLWHDACHSKSVWQISLPLSSTVSTPSTPSTTSTTSTTSTSSSKTFSSWKSHLWVQTQCDRVGSAHRPGSRSIRGPRSPPGRLSKSFTIFDIF